MESQNIKEEYQEQIFKQNVKEEYQEWIFKQEPQDVKEEYDPELNVPDNRSFSNNNVTKTSVWEKYLSLKRKSRGGGDEAHLSVFKTSKPPDDSNNNVTSGWEKPDLTGSSEVGAKGKSRGGSSHLSVFKTSKPSHDSDDWVQCPKCFVKLKNKNLLKHLRKHGDGVKSNSNATKASVHEKPDVTESSLSTEESSVAGAKIEFYINEGFNLGLKKPMDWSTCPLCLIPTRNDKISKHLAEQHGYKTRNEGDQENLEKAKLEAIKIGPFPH